MFQDDSIFERNNFIVGYESKDKNYLSSRYDVLCTKQYKSS